MVEVSRRAPAMKLRSSVNSLDRSVIAVVGGAIMDLIFEIERMPMLDESLDALSLAYKPGGKGPNTAVAIYRAQHQKPIDNMQQQQQQSTAAPADLGSTTASASAPGHERPSEVLVYLNTAVGDDAFGRQLKKHLAQNGVDISGVRNFSDNQTGTCAVFVERFGGESRDIAYPGANMNWKPRYQDSVECLADGNKPDLIVTHLGIKRETIERVLETASKFGVDTLLNPSPVVYLLSTIYKNVTHLVVNLKEAAQLSGCAHEALNEQRAWQEAAEYFMEQGVQHVVITLGPGGAFYATKGKNGLVPAVANVQVKDTTGGGDTFVGNYALEYVRQKLRGEEWDIRKAVERGCRAAARTIEQLGAQESIPWANEIGGA